MNWSLPRDRQIMLGRQNLYDGTWEKTPSMGWTFVPLVEYQGGGEAATLEPLAEHLDAYEAHLVQNFGYGVQACYRGPRLYDTEATRALVKKWVGLVQEIPGHPQLRRHPRPPARRPRPRRASCTSIPRLKEKGLAPVLQSDGRGDREDACACPLYYTGLTDKARIREAEGPARNYRLDREYRIALPVTVPAHGFAWFVID